MAKAIIGTKLPFEQFKKVVREGVGMMPATPEADLSEQALDALYTRLRGANTKASPTPLTAKVGQMLTTERISLFFLCLTVFSAAFGIRVLAYYLQCAGWRELGPYIRRFGRARAAGVFIRALLVEGLLVRSLWRRDRFRWFMHGLVLYGFTGLILADVLIQIQNPTRTAMAITEPAKILAILSGAALLSGIAYVLIRSRRDPFFDNGHTRLRDVVFIHLMLHTVLSGFLTFGIAQLHLSTWTLPIYLYHLVAIAMLIGSAPFTRFSHAWVVPALIGMTRVTEAIVEANVDIGFRREPSPGLHHKSERIAESLLKQLGPSFDESFKIRYYP